MQIKRITLTVVGLAMANVVSAAACRRSPVQEIIVARADAGPDWVIWDLDPAVGTDKCEIHGTRLTTVVVPMEWGYAPPEVFDRQFLGAEGEQFPYADDSINGGCIRGEYTHARVKHCSKCAEAKERWLSEHPKVDRSGRPRLTSR